MPSAQALQKRFLRAACQDAAAESDKGCSQQLLGLLIHIVCCDAILLVEGGACRTKCDCALKHSKVRVPQGTTCATLQLCEAGRLAVQTG